MNIIIPDIDKYIVDLVDLHSLANLLLVNKFFNTIISAKPVMSQWKYLNSIQIDTTNNIFKKACSLGFVEYANYLINGNTIDIHADNEYAFRCSCLNGHINIALWLVKLGKSSGYTKIDIHANGERAFRCSCLNGHINIALWLVKLGESSGYTKIDIHAWDDYALQACYENGHLDVAQWLITNEYYNT